MNIIKVEEQSYNTCSNSMDPVWEVLSYFSYISITVLNTAHW